MKLKYTKDENNFDILTDDSSYYQVMMEWEKPYMEKCIESLRPVGKVLEIGFGMGFSARKICSYDIESYTVIECSPVVWNKYEEFRQEMSKEKPEIEMFLIKGRWQDVLETLAKFG